MCVLMRRYLPSPRIFWRRLVNRLAPAMIGIVVVAAACGAEGEARREVETLARSVSAQSDKKSVRGIARTFHHAWIVEDTADTWRLLTPNEFGARQWVAAITFGRDGRIRSVQYNTMDALGTKYRAKGVPSDQCFDPAGCS